LNGADAQRMIRAMSPDSPVREEIVLPLRRCLRWLASLRDERGRIVCPDHQVEHTGKSAYAIVSACELLAIDPARDADFLRELAISQAERLVANLVVEENSVCQTFRPGRHDPFNCSNSVIDGGACSDALAHLVTVLGPSLPGDLRERCVRACLLHARTYLRYAVVDKGVPAQRAWGLTGLAGAFALEADPVLEQPAIEAVGELEAVQHGDGSFPYHPLAWGAQHPGSSDVSAFYQSRVTGFVAHALERMGRDPRDPLFAPPLVRGLDFLAALQAPDGIKCGLVEAKPWYWGASYEVASHPFDVHALATGWRLFGRERYGRAAVAAFRAWAAHLKESGEPRSHVSGPGRERSYQCSVFWAAHAAWIARAARDLESVPARAVPAPAVLARADPDATELGPPASGRAGIELAVTWFPDAQLARLEDARAIAWIRGARPAVNVHHGSPHGAGLLRVWDKREARDRLERCRLHGSNEGEWTARGTTSLARGWRSGSSELRFSLWLARVHLRAGRFGDALLAPARVFRRGVLAFAHPRASSAFDLAPEIEVRGDGVVLRSALAQRDGTRVAGSAIEREFSIDGDGLEVVERVVSPGAARNLAYRTPGQARALPGKDGAYVWRMP
jgi:hypothetical protein